MTHLDAFADALIDAHQTGTRCAPDLPAPATPAEAYQVQRRVMAALGPTAGFKTALKPGTAPIMAPIFACHTVASGATVALGDTMGVELEVGWQITAPLPAPTDRDFDAALARCVRPLAVIELVDTRLHGPLADDAMAKLADFQINHGLVVGTPPADWDGRDPGTVTAQMRVGDDLLLNGRAAVPGGSALATLKVLASNIGAHCGGLQVGQIVITGSLHSLAYVRHAAEVRGQIDTLGSVCVTLR